MTTLSSSRTNEATSRTETRPLGRIVCATAAVAAIAPFVTSELSGDSGAEITAGLVDDATLLMSGAIVAVLVAAALFLAAVRVGRAVGGDAGLLVAAAGSAVALMYAGYYAVFGAGGVVASQMLTEPGAGLGEAASLVLNVMEITRYAPGLALVAAVLFAGRLLPRWVGVTAGVLVVLCLVPFTSWVAALLIPVWLGAVAAALR
jgi:hypothetical protein